MIGLDTSATINAQTNDLRNEELHKCKLVCPYTLSARPSAAFKEMAEYDSEHVKDFNKDGGMRDIEEPVSMRKSTEIFDTRKAANN
jgi:hypothetical protein